MTTRPDMLPADHIRELIRPFTTTETDTRHAGRRVPVPTTDWRTNPGWTIAPRDTNHTVTHPPLLDQLARATTCTTAGGEHMTRPGSKPAARLDALDVLARIDRESRDLAKTHDIPALPLRERLSRLAGEVVINDKKAVDTVRRWWGAARIVTAWDTPAYAPPVPCPNTDCERRGTLRIRMDGDRPTSAYCVECSDFYQTDDMPRLAEYVRWAAEHLSGPRHWLHDEEGELVECVECLATRDAMGERALLRARVERESRKASA